MLFHHLFVDYLLTSYQKFLLMDSASINRRSVTFYDIFQNNLDIFIKPGQIKKLMKLK